MTAGQNTGDASATRAGGDQGVATHPAAATDNPVAKLQADSLPKPGDTTAAKDNSAQPSDKALDKVRETTEKPAVDAYGHLTAAQIAANEIAQYVRADKKETDTVTVKGEGGVEHTETVGDRVAALKKIVDTECATAVSQSNGIKQDEVAQLIQSARNQRNDLATQLGLDPNKLSKDTIAEARKSTTDSGTAAKLDQLAQLQTKFDTYRLWENAPAYTRMLYSSFKAAGLTDPETGMQKGKNGGLHATQKDIADAVQLLTEAGTNKDLRHSRLYTQAVATVLPKLENSSVKVQAITKDLQDATKAGAKGDKVEQEKLLKDAVSQADQTNTAAIAQLLRDPRFVQSQRDPAVLTDMANNVVMSSTARLQYAQFLTDQGKFAEAQGLVLRVKTECPEVMYTADPKDPTKISYQQSRFVDLAKLDQAVTASSNVQPNQINGLLFDFNRAMTKGEIVTKGGAQDILTSMYTAANKNVAQVADGQRGLDAAQKQLDQRKKDLNAKTYLTDGAKTLEENQIDREAAMIQQQKTLLDADAKEANLLLNVVKLNDARLDVAEEKRDAAKAKLAEVKAGDPDLAVAKNPDGSDSFYTQLEKASQEPSWWDRNWRKVGAAAAIGAGVVAAGLTIWSGPGAVLCGAGTTAALMATMGIAVGSASLAGGAAFLGTHEVLHSTGLVSEKVDLSKDFKQGLAIGAETGFFVAMTPLVVAAGTIGTAGAVGVGGAEVATVGTEAALGTGAALDTGAALGTGAVAAGTDAAVVSTGAAAVGTGAAVVGADAVVGTTAAGTTAAGASVASEATTTAAQTFNWGAKLASAGRMSAVTFSGSVVNEGVNRFTSHRTWAQSGIAVASQTALPVFGVAAGGMIKGFSLAGRAAGLLKAAPEVAAATDVGGYVAPQFLSRTNLIWGLGLGIGAPQAYQYYTEHKKADQDGPAYAYGPGNTVGEDIQNSTSILGPYNATRGWDANRQSANAGAGEITAIMHSDIGPGDINTASGEAPPVPVDDTQSDFTEAGQLGGPDKP